MAQSSGLLDQVRIASPCTADWEAMTGDERVRFCSQCSLHVYNLAQMTREEAEALLREREGRLCARVYRRRDGTVVTKDCPVGVRKARRWLVTQVAGVSGVFGIFAVLAPMVRADKLRQSEAFQRLRHSRFGQAQPLAAVLKWIDPTPEEFSVTAGAIAWPAPVGPTAPSPRGE